MLPARSGNCTSVGIQSSSNPRIVLVLHDSVMKASSSRPVSGLTLACFLVSCCVFGGVHSVDLTNTTVAVRKDTNVSSLFEVLSVDGTPSDEAYKLVTETVSDEENSTEDNNNNEDGALSKVQVIEILEPRVRDSDVRLRDHLLDLRTIRERLDANETTPRPTTPRVPTLEEILDVFNVQRLAGVWRRRNGRHDVTRGCNETMEVYMEALAAGTTWAQKMSDATGRYTAGFFWGNSYWSGSASLCEATSDHDGPVLHSVPVTTSSLSPFPLGFFSLRLELAGKDHLTPIPRNILLGLCLPRVCTAHDARSLLELSADNAVGKAERKVTVVNVRSPHEYYDMTRDPTFWILVASSVFVAVMLFSGTIYDLYIESTRATSFISSNYTYEVTRLPQNMVDKSKASANGDVLNNNDAGEMNGKISRFTNTSGDSEAAMMPDFCIDSNLCLTSKVLLSFSIRRNMLTICDRSVGSDTIPTIHGLRSISMAWVILGHTCIVIFKYSDNTVFREVVETNFLFQAISNGTFSVDTFFFISGLLVSFLYFRTTSKIDITKVTNATGMKSNVLQFVGMLLYRFARLTVPYMFVLGVVEVIMKWFYFNSVFEAPTLDHINCPNYWWRNILYINTLFPVEDMCMLWSWYLADDTQFYIIGAVLLIVAVRHFRVSAVALGLFMVSSWATTAYIAYSNDHMPNLDDPLALFDKIYDKPWTRLGPYLVGMAVGWILFKTDCKIKMTKLAVCAGWLSSITCLLALVYGLYNAHLSALAAAAYSSLSHTAWALSLAWIVIACSTGYGGYVNSILSMSILYPFSRVTYCAYLIHPIVVRIMVMNIDSPLHLASNSVMILFFGQVVCSYVLSFVVSLSFEAPIVSLLRLVSPTKQKKNQ